MGLQTGAGQDTLSGGTGQDYMDGGAGGDVFDAADGAQDTVEGRLNDGAADTLLTSDGADVLRNLP